MRFVADPVNKGLYIAAQWSSLLLLFTILSSLGNLLMSPPIDWTPRDAVRSSVLLVFVQGGCLELHGLRW
jgi:hypothetical protein